MSLCHCDSEKKFTECCSPFLAGDANPATAVECMRSRYSAFVEANVDYITKTHHPDFMEDYSPEDTQAWAKESEWLGLKIVESEDGQAGDSEGTVEFIANYKQQGKTFRHHELSTFQKRDGQWYFVDGQIINDPIVRDTPKVGRNEPCPCNSGKKFKKCCGR